MQTNSLFLKNEAVIVKLIFIIIKALVKGLLCQTLIDTLLLYINYIISHLNYILF